MKIGLLGWDYSGIDPDGISLVEYGRERGHEMSFFTLEEIAYRPGPSGVALTLGGEPRRPSTPSSTAPSCTATTGRTASSG